jgi:hypothetical protein
MLESHFFLVLKLTWVPSLLKPIQRKTSVLLRPKIALMLRYLLYHLRHPTPPILYLPLLTLEALTSFHLSTPQDLTHPQILGWFGKRIVLLSAPICIPYCLPPPLHHRLSFARFYCPVLQLFLQTN